jgi:hypothetical protein
MPKRALLLLALAAAGCATDTARIEKDGVAYGVTEGPFRGRWWNYYERGRSFLDGGYFAEAQKDFEEALRERDVDQRWARTYGLHFAPQYFPNRELGVALYHQGAYAEAAARLEASHAQQPSARTEWYLHETRKKLSEGDTEAPTLQIGPDAANALSTRSAMLLVTASDNGYIDTLEVDGRALNIGRPAATITTSAPVQIAAGPNRIAVSVRDAAGLVTETTWEVYGDFDGPVVSVDMPATLPGVLEGAVADRAGVAHLTIAGVDAELTGSGAARRFRVALSAPDLAQPLVCIAEDSLGNQSTVKLSADRLKVADLRADLMATGPLMTLAQPADTGTLPKVNLANLANGQHYLMDEIVVDIEIEAPAGVRSLSLNNVPVELLPDRGSQRLSRRVTLPRTGPQTIVAVLEDSNGAHTEARADIERIPTEVEQLSNRLSLAILGNIWEGPNRVAEAEETFIADELNRLLYDDGRFDLVARDALPEVLTEQELAAAAGSRNGASPLRDVVPAELMAVGLVRKDTESVEIILQAISLETSQLMGYADIAGRANNREELRALVSDLTLRFLQEFPRVQGQIAAVRGKDGAISNLSESDRIRPKMKCLLFRQGEEIHDPVTGALLGAPSEVIAEGWFDDVTSTMSTIRLPQGQGPIEVQDFVITK